MAVASVVSSGLKLSTGLWPHRPLVLIVITSVCWPCHREESPPGIHYWKATNHLWPCPCDVIINNLIKRCLSV